MQLGSALDRGDCFFDAVAQSLNYQGKGSYTAKDLREVCRQYVVTLDKGSKEANWIYQRFLRDANRLNPNDNGEATLAAARNYQHYMANIGFTAADIDAGQGLNITIAIWGEQDIDGRILSEKLGIKLHAIKLLEAEETLILAHQLDRKSIVDVDYAEQAIIHIAIFNNHFVPLLPNLLTDSPDVEKKGKILKML